MTIQDLGLKLHEMYNNAKDGEKVVMFHLFINTLMKFKIVIIQQKILKLLPISMNHMELKLVKV